jgi:hypothetical protein
MVGDGVSGCLSYGMPAYVNLTSSVHKPSSWPQAIVMLTSTSNTRKIVTIFVLNLTSDYTVCKKFSSGLFSLNALLIIWMWMWKLKLPQSWIKTNTPVLWNRGSGMFIPDPDFYPSRLTDPWCRILDPGSNNSTKRGGRNFFVLPFFVAANIIKL